MTPHEEEMLTEIQTLHARLAKAERAKLKWMFFTILSLAALGFVIWLNFA